MLLRKLSYRDVVHQFCLGYAQGKEKLSCYIEWSALLYAFFIQKPLTAYQRKCIRHVPDAQAVSDHVAFKLLEGFHYNTRDIPDINNINDSRLSNIFKVLGININAIENTAKTTYAEFLKDHKQDGVYLTIGSFEDHQGKEHQYSQVWKLELNNITYAICDMYLPRMVFPTIHTIPVEHFLETMRRDDCLHYYKITGYYFQPAQ